MLKPPPDSAPHRWHHTLKRLFTHALERYRAGEREPERFFNAAQTAALASIGMAAQELYDFAEDHLKYDGDPDWETVLLVSAVRRDYFLTVQGGAASAHRIAADGLPPKDAALGGLPWLPRLIKKAEAKLRGEMPPEVMFGCAGDRKFFKNHGLYPADFLRRVWAAAGDEGKVLAFVQRGKDGTAGEG